MDSADGFCANVVADKARRMIIKDMLRFMRYNFSKAKIKQKADQMHP
jgi:hypothetical protein